MRPLRIILLPLVAAIAATALGQYEPREEGHVRGEPYIRYGTTDKYHRVITFYLSETTSKDPQPLVVYIQGSGYGSLFTSQNGRLVPQMGHITVEDVFHDHARVLVVEKPGVTYLDPGTGSPVNAAPKAFLQEHSFDRWVEAVEASIKAARSLPEIDPKSMLVIGHSEGGLVACKIAHDMPEVTHVATLAGGCLNQLTDLVQLAREGLLYSEVSDDPDKRAQQMLDDAKAALAEPDRTDKFFLGFTYLRWSTFLVTSPLEELMQVNSRIYIGQGSEDKTVPPCSSDNLYLQLLLRHKDVTYDRVAGADHSFAVKDADGWKDLMGRIERWFFAQPGKT